MIVFFNNFFKIKEIYHRYVKYTNTVKFAVKYIYFWFDLSIQYSKSNIEISAQKSIFKANLSAKYNYKGRTQAMHKNQRTSRSKSQGKLKEQRPEMNVTNSQQNLKPKRMNRRQFRLGRKQEQSALQNKSNSYSRTRCTLNTNEPKQTDGPQPSINKDANMKKLSLKQRHAQKYRCLLPDYLNAKLSQELAQLYKIADKLDKYLIRVSKKQMGQTFNNLQEYMTKMQGIELLDIHIKQINFVVPGYYNHYKDPLRNLVIQYPKGQNFHLRHQNLRKMLYQTSKSMKAEGREHEPVQTRQLYTKRTQFFYSDKHFRNKQQDEPYNKIPSQLVNDIYEHVDQQQSNLLINPEQAQPSKQILNQILQILPILYRQRKISNMFKVTLVSLIDQRIKCGYTTANKALQKLVQQESAKLDGILQQNSINGRSIIGCQPHISHG